jgi:hypothetical protein
MIFGGRNMGDSYFKPDNFTGRVVLDKEVLVYNTDVHFSGSITETRELFNKTLHASKIVLYENRN